MQNYCIIREARKDELADEITYHIIIYSFNLKNQKVDKIHEKQLNSLPIDSSVAGFQCEKVSYYRQGHQIYYFVVERDLDIMRDTISFYKYNLVLAKEIKVKEFEKDARIDSPLLVVQICKNIGCFGDKTNIQGGLSEF